MEWPFVAIAVLGTLCVSRFKRVWLGHWLWLVSNVGLLACALHAGQWAHAGLFAAYLCITLAGLWTWRKEP